MRINSYIRIAKGWMLILLSSCILFACQKEEDPFDYLLLIGKWEMVSEHCVEYFDGEMAYDETYTYPAGESFLEINSDGSGITYDTDSIVVTFSWSRTDNMININADDDGMMDHFLIQSLDQNMLIYRVRILEDLLQEELEYISNCDYTLSRVDDGP